MRQVQSIILLITFFFAFDLYAQESLTLNEAVETALKKNPALLSVNYSKQSSQYFVDTALSNFFPKIDLGYEAAKTNSPVYSFMALLNQGRFTQPDFAVDKLNNPSGVSNQKFSVSARQPIYTGGKIISGYRLAKLASEISLQEEKKEIQKVTFEVIKGYFGVVLAKEGYEVVISAIKTAEDVVKRAESFYKNGLVVESDLLSAKVFLSELKQEEVDGKKRIEMSKSYLNLLMGNDIDTPFELKESLTENYYIFPSLDELYRTAIEKRGDLKQAEAGEGIGKLNVSIAKSEFHPSLGLFANYDINSRTLDNGKESYMIGIGVKLNIFNGLGDFAKVKSAKALSLKAKYQKEAALNGIKLEVKDAYLSVESAKAKVAAVKESAALAEESLRIIQNRYKANLTTMVDLLTAQTTFKKTKFNYLKALYDLKVTYAVLEKSTGNLEKGSSKVLRGI